MFRLSVICALSIAWLSHSADAALREYTFTLRQLLGTNGTGTGSLSPDCTNIWKQKRWLYLVGNGTGTQSATLPGPTIEADEGDRIRVTVVNENEVMAATIHWHGIHQKGTVYSDGASAVTQCSLGPFQSQTYEFNAYPAGTHYYHSHQGLTASDGLAGAIIVRPIDQEPFQYDEEREVVLMDYFSSTSLQKGSGLQSPQFKWIGSPDSLLLNGKGLSNTCKDFDGDQPWTKCIKKCSKNAEGNIEESCIAKCDQPGMPVCSDSCSDTSKWTERIRVEKGKIYRFRIINAGGLIFQNFAISSHTMTVVEADGHYTEPIEVSNLTIAPGQRYSVLVTADQDEDNYWMQSTFIGRNQTGNPTGNFVLSYDNSPEELPPSDELPEHPAWNDTEELDNFFRSLKTLNASTLDEYRALEASDEDINRYVITLTQAVIPARIQTEFGENRYWAMNNISFAYPENGVPLIGTAVKQSLELGWPLAGPLDGTIDLPKRNPISWNVSESMIPFPGKTTTQGTSVIRLEVNETAEFVIENSLGLDNASEPHPWHFHGHSFWVVGRGQGGFNEIEDVPNYNLDNPILRDTVIQQGNEWVALRFVANNPGVWYFHCHIEAHLA